MWHLILLSKAICLMFLWLLVHFSRHIAPGAPITTSAFSSVIVWSLWAPNTFQAEAEYYDSHLLFRRCCSCSLLDKQSSHLFILHIMCWQGLSITLYLLLGADWKMSLALNIKNCEVLQVGIEYLEILGHISLSLWLDILGIWLNISWLKGP